MIRELDGVFVLDTKKTTYAFHILEIGQAEHLYYGAHIRLGRKEADALALKGAFAPGNTISYNRQQKQITLENRLLEWSGRGKGDIREPLVQMRFADGSETTDFVFEQYEITSGKEAFDTLPGSYDEAGQVQHLCLTLREKEKPVKLELHYYVYEDCDVISRAARLVNEGEQPVEVVRLLSLQLDLSGGDLCWTEFTGAWTREMQKRTANVSSGRHVSESVCGVSSNRANPFVMLHEKDTGDEHGICYGFNLIYSGNHYETVQRDSFGQYRVLTGIHPEDFCIKLEQGEAFEAPEAVMTWSGEGFQMLSNQMHRFVREHIVRGYWQKKERPILLNSWEAAYFDISESKLLKLAKAARDVGIELFVMDDGWFGSRENDEKSLGDWQENKAKLPGGLKGLCDKVNALGLSFGIWVEPEMVNEDSDLYRKHPEWTMEIPDREHSEGRNQRLLNLGRKEVQDYLVEEMSRVFGSANIAYVKWDMNRIASDVFDRMTGEGRRGTLMHRYYIGLYRVMGELTKRFPRILFEGCASGGNRFDLGILCYFPQIWASDNTDALCRMDIQQGYSYGYPQSVYTAHVSGCPNHQTLRVTPLETRFAVAAFGVLGYECNLCDMKKEDLEAIRQQVTLYKAWRNVLQFGQFYRVCEEDGDLTWTIAQESQERAVGVMFRKLAKANPANLFFRARGLASDAVYSFYGRQLQYDVRQFGDLVNTVAPIHIRQDSLLHQVVSKFVKLDGETEDYQVYGDFLMHAGICLKQNYGGTGFNEQVRFYQDFASRMYFMEKTQETKNPVKELENKPEIIDNS